MLRTALSLIFTALFLTGQACAEAPPSLAGYSISDAGAPDALDGYSITDEEEGAADYDEDSVDEGQDPDEEVQGSEDEGPDSEEDVQGSADDAQQDGSMDVDDTVDSGRAAQVEYYNQKMSTVEGTITEIDIESGSMTVMTAGGEARFSFDGDTRFQVLLRPIEPAKVKTGSKMAGLYREVEGAQYLGRVMLMDPTKVYKSKKKSSKKKHKRKKRRRR